MVITTAAPVLPPADAAPKRPERLLTVAQAAEVLQLSRGKVYELIADGRLPSVSIDRSRRVREADLDAFIRALSA